MTGNIKKEEYFLYDSSDNTDTILCVSYRHDTIYRGGHTQSELEFTLFPASDSISDISGDFLSLRRWIREALFAQPPIFSARPASWFWEATIEQQLLFGVKQFRIHVRFYMDRS